MKTFREFLSEDAASDTQSTINRDVKGKGGDIAYRSKRGKQFSVVDLLKRKEKDNNGGGQDQETSQEKDQETRQEKPDGPGKQPDRKPQPYRSSRIRPRKPQPYRSSKPQSSKPQRSLPQGKERPALPAGKDSMVAKRVAAAKQTPQHKQISARPASTAMAGSRQRPAIRPAKSNLSRDNMGVQDVKVQDHGPNPQKRLNPAKSNRQLPPAKSNLSRDNMGVQKVNVQDLGPTTQKRLNPAKSNRQLPAARNTQRQLPPGR